jgi:tetratricopeptide (TPR) repeat protein
MGGGTDGVHRSHRPGWAEPRVRSGPGSLALSGTPPSQVLHVCCPCRYWSNRSATYFQLQQYDRAAEDANISRRINPGWVKAYLREGNALMALHRYGPDASPGHPRHNGPMWCTRSLVCVRCLCACVRVVRYEDAACVFLEGSRVDPDDQSSMAELFQKAIRLGRKQHEEAMARAAEGRS